MGSVSSQELFDKGGEPFVIGPFEPSDRQKLEAFYHDFEPKRGAQGLPPVGEERIMHWLDGVLAIGVHLIGERDGDLIGHAFLLPTGRAGIAEYAVFIRSDQRGRGVGTVFHKVAAQAARDAGYSQVWLTVEPHNRAALMSYRKAGFRYRPGTIFSTEAEMEMDL
ncbi:MAG TPA: GNAT family N-acetyltransferase [Longimicrobiaceae bacterium]|nr:GNAT family N-acetyltransferase [Longimicrobiaceae bacterium]